MIEHNPVITHIAGDMITINGRYRRQRCSWCGSVLIDSDNEPSKGWTFGVLVDVQGLDPIQFTLNTSKKLPDTFCGNEETFRA